MVVSQELTLLSNKSKSSIFFRHLPKWSYSAIGGKIVLSFLVLIFLTIRMTKMEQILKSSSPFGVFNLEFVWTYSNAVKILESWTPDLISLEIFSTYIDFLFMLSYAVFLSSAYVYLLKRSSPIMIQKITFGNEKLITLYYYLPWIAMLFDFFENMSILHILYSIESFSKLRPIMISTFATLKFSIIGIFVLFLIIMSILNKNNKIK